MSGDELRIRPATMADRPAIIELCRASLGWVEEDPNEAFFSWKHDQNPFGASPSWVAVTPDGSLAGVRVFLRWAFTSPDGRSVSAVRAVDTATHPDWQGKGIFTRLTLGGLEQLADEGLDVVFNTPNDQSRPGYLKMGWSEVGRVPVALRVRSVTRAPRLVGARAAADLWSRPVDVALDASEALSAHDELQRLLDAVDTPRGLATARSVEYLQWRYSFEPLRYRALPLGDHLRDGLVLFRVRRRGTATELTICDVLAPRGASARSAIGYLLRRSDADYAIRCHGPGSARDGFVPASRLGPILTWRPVNRPGVPSLSELSLTLGDVELF